jgi:hypothetical protein
VLIIRPAHNSGLAKAAIEIRAKFELSVRQPSPSPSVSGKAYHPATFDNFFLSFFTNSLK